MEPSKFPVHETRELDALRESERRFRAIYEQAPIGMTLVDIRTGRFIEFNAKFCDIVGRTGEELRQMDFVTLTHPDDRAENLRLIAQLRAEALESFTFEKRYIRPDGSVIWVSATVVAMWRKGEEPDFYMTLIEDISGRKATDAERQRQITFDQLITAILGRFASCTGAEIDQEIRESLRTVGQFIGAEEAFVSQISADMSTWSVVYSWSAVGVDLKEKFKAILFGEFPWAEQQLFSGKNLQITDIDDWPGAGSYDREKHEIQGVRSILIMPLRGRGGRVRGGVGLRTLTRSVHWSEEDVRRLRIFADAIANVLERKQIEDALYDSRGTLQQILDTVPHRIFWKDRASNYLGCNMALARDLGLGSPAEIVGKNDSELFTKEAAERYRADDLQIIESGEAKMGYEDAESLPDGTVIWMRVSKIPLRDSQNRVSGLLGVAEDMRMMRQARLALEAAKEAAEAANQAKDQFIAVLSHELRTPLTPVLAMVTAMEDSGRLPETWRADIEAIHRNVELEARLIDDLLDVTRISQGKLILRTEPLDVHASLQAALEICRSELEAKHQELVLALEARRHWVQADPARLGQVFWNLVKNAVKFTPEGGRIEVRTADEAGGRVQITVADNGIGIEADVLPRVFNAFEQGEASRKRRFGGLGLGLSIAKALVEMHHGTLAAASEGRSHGALFTVDLETIEPGPKLAAEPPRAQPEAGPARRILLVEDHEDTARILSRLLRQWGYTVATAGSVATALERAKQAQFDLLVSDLGLPDGSGLEIARHLRGRVRAVALSGYGTDEDIRASLEAGFSEHLTKPVSIQTLRAAVNKLLA
ncbi:MAG: PAS domain S-box protein [Chthoniobacteraceae bacterium]